MRKQSVLGSLLRPTHREPENEANTNTYTHSLSLSLSLSFSLSHTHTHIHCTYTHTAYLPTTMFLPSISPASTKSFEIASAESVFERKTSYFSGPPSSKIALAFVILSMVTNYTCLQCGHCTYCTIRSQPCG